MSAKSRASLIYEWADGDDRYRLLSVGKFSAGYEDKFVIERLTADALGEPRWDSCWEWDAGKSLAGLLVGAVKSLLVDQRERDHEAARAAAKQTTEVSW